MRVQLVLAGFFAGLFMLSTQACKSESSACGQDGDGVDGDEAAKCSSTGSGVATPTCASYCATLMQNCTGGDGSVNGGNPDPSKTNQQFTGMEQCMASCAAMPLGTMADQSGNTVGCRLNHANAAASDPKKECTIAGPGGEGICGSDCDGYCQIAMKYCVAANQAAVYTDLADCQKQCAATTDDVPFNIARDSGDHVACLLAHVQDGSVAPTDHCVNDLVKDPSKSFGSATCQ